MAAAEFDRRLRVRVDLERLSDLKCVVAIAEQKPPIRARSYFVAEVAVGVGGRGGDGRGFGGRFLHLELDADRRARDRFARGAGEVAGDHRGVFERDRDRFARGALDARAQILTADDRRFGALLFTSTVWGAEQVVFGGPIVAKSEAQTCAVLAPSWKGNSEVFRSHEPARAAGTASRTRR
jgi:hypothetical protein